MSSADNRGGWVAADLVETLYDDLRSFSAPVVERADAVDPADIVYQAYRRLTPSDRDRWQTEAQYRALSAGEMYRVLVDHGRAARLSRRRHVPTLRVTDALALTSNGNLEFEPLDHALERLRRLDQESHTIIVQHYFGGLSYDEIARLLDRPEAWVLKQAGWATDWLRENLDDAGWLADGGAAPS